MSLRANVTFTETREMTADLLIESIKTFGLLSDAHQSIWFKLGILIDTVKLYIVILVQVTMIFIQGQRSTRKQKLLDQLPQFSIDLGRVWYVVPTC